MVDTECAHRFGEFLEIDGKFNPRILNEVEASVDAHNQLIWLQKDTLYQQMEGLELSEEQLEDLQCLKLLTVWLSTIHPDFQIVKDSNGVFFVG